MTERATFRERPLKRSKALVLTGLMAGGGVSMTACDHHDAQQNAQAPKAVAYANLQQCKTAGVVPADQCEKAYNQALADNAANAPHYNDRLTCEQKYGVDRCVPRNENGGSFFTPLLTGFIVGQALSNMGGGYRGGALYQDRYGGWGGGSHSWVTRQYIPVGRTLGSSGGFGAPAAYAPSRVQSRSSVISRGGFGGGGGGGHSFGG